MKRWLKSWNIWYNFKWNQPYLNRGLNLNRHLNSLNSATVCLSNKRQHGWTGQNQILCYDYLIYILNLL